MPITDANTLKSWFQSKDKPTQEQFWSLIDSFRHKQDNVPASDVDGLSGLLSNYLLKKEVSEPGVYDPAENYFFGAANQQYVSFANESSADPQFQSEGFYRLVEDAPAGETPETHPAHWSYQGAVWGEITIADVAGLVGELEALNEREGLSLLKTNRTIWVSPNGDDANDNFVATGMRAIQLLNGNTVGATIVVLSGEYNWEITEENLPIAEYPNQLAGDGLTWVFCEGARLQINSERYLFPVFQRSAVDNQWSWGFRMLGYAHITKIGAGGFFDLDGRLYNPIGDLSWCGLFIEFDMLISDSEFINPTPPAYGYASVSKYLIELSIKGNKLDAPFDFHLWLNTLVVRIDVTNTNTASKFIVKSEGTFSNGGVFKEFMLNAYQIKADQIVIDTGLLLKSSINVTYIKTKQDVVVCSHSNQTNISIGFIDVYGIIFTPFLSDNFSSNAQGKFNAIEQHITVSAKGSITYYHGYNLACVLNLNFDANNKVISLLNSDESWTNQLSNRTINLSIPRAIDKLIVENCDLNIITNSTIGKIITSNATVERYINIKQPITLDSANETTAYIELCDNYRLNLENTVSIGESLATPLSQPVSGVQLCGNAQLIFNGGGLQSMVNDPLFKLIRNKKTVAETDVLVKGKGGVVNDLSFKAESQLAYFKASIDSFAPVYMNVHVGEDIYTFSVADTSPYTTIAELVAVLVSAMQATVEFSDVLSVADNNPNVEITGLVKAGIWLECIENCTMVESIWEETPLTVEDYISGDYRQTLANGYYINESYAVPGDYDITIMADRAGKLHITLNYWIFDGVERTIELLPISDFSVKLQDFVDKNTSPAFPLTDSSYAHSLNVFSKFRDSGTPLAYSNLCNEEGEMMVYRDSDGYGSPLYKSESNYGDIDLRTESLTFTINPSYSAPSVAPFAIKRTLTIVGLINSK